MIAQELRYPAKGSLAFSPTRLLVALGILPWLLVLALAILGAVEPRVLSGENLFNVFRQSSYLAVVAMGQMIVLLTGNFDLSVGANMALVSIVVNVVSGHILEASPGSNQLAMIGGIAAGLLVGLLIGVVNGIGVAVMKVHSFIMTLGTMSIALGIALFISGGMPVSGTPSIMGEIFAYGRLFGLPAPLIASALLLALLYFLLNWTRFGRHLYAIGSNLQAARLSGVNTARHIFLAHTLCGAIAAFGAVLLTARIGTGETHMGDQFALASITACVLGGVSLFGGSGHIVNVALGAFFLSLLANGMIMVRIGSYAQIIADGALLILAIWAEQGRLLLARRLWSK
jgi:ribose transport system permease protein